ncbi:MAG: RluA family pseudouridine synthase [Acidobacteria bacterium]|nr:RluA family pseudouridine synthase [Acidobacteriota bacterium]
MSGESSRSAARFRVGPAYAGYRLDQFLQRMIPKLSRNRIQKAIDERVRLSWEAPVKASTPVREDGEVWVDDPQVNEEAIEFDPTVLYDDGDLLAIDKPPGVVVHPTHSHLRNTVITLLRRQMNSPELTLAHRLDAETSGVLLLGRHTWAARRAQSAFQRGKVEKSYLAIVFGRPAEDRFTVDLPLGYHSRDSFVFRQLPGGRDARESLTEIEVLERMARVSLVRAFPKTGRRHQIRAHLAAAGHPIVGDKLYVLDDRAYRRYLKLGRLDEELLARVGAARLMLHSATLSLPHPRQAGERIEITAPLPADMAAWIEAERARRAEESA